MADLYVRDTGAGGAWTGTVYTTLEGAAAVDAAGDTIYLSQAHTESKASAMTINLAGTEASPVQVICANDSAQPPTASAGTSSVVTTGNANLTFLGTRFRVVGGIYKGGSGANNARIVLLSSAGSFAEFIGSELGSLSTGNGGIDLIASANSTLSLLNCIIELKGSAQRLDCTPANNCVVFVKGGGFKSGLAAITRVFDVNNARIYAEGFDFSLMPASANIFNRIANGQVLAIVRNSKLPAGWSGAVLGGTLTQNQRAEMYNCDDGDTNYRLLIVDYAGGVRHELVIVRTGGATDGDTPISWRMLTSANARADGAVLAGPEIVRWNDTTGSAITVTVEVITDGVTLTNAEAWLEVQYLGTSGFPLGSFIADDVGGDNSGNILATPANQTSSSVGWTTTGLTTPVKQKLSVTFTPQEKGFIHAVVKLAKPSTTMYVCPKLEIT